MNVRFEKRRTRATTAESGLSPPHAEAAAGPGSDGRQACRCGSLYVGLKAPASIAHSQTTEPPKMAQGYDG